MEQNFVNNPALDEVLGQFAQSKRKLDVKLIEQEDSGKPYFQKSLYFMLKNKLKSK